MSRMIRRSRSVSRMGAAVGARLKRGRRDAIVPHCRKYKKRRRREDLRLRASANTHASNMEARVGIGQSSPIHCQQNSRFPFEFKHYSPELATTTPLLATTFTDSFTDSPYSFPNRRTPCKET